MKKMVLLLLAMAACLAAAVTGTLAYFTADGTATNVITAANLHIALRESMVSTVGEELVAFESRDGVCPGETVSKIVQVTNTGAQPAYIRVAVSKAITLTAGIDAAPDMALISLDTDTARWTERDGYWYYRTPLLPGETSAPLFTGVHIAEEMGNDYRNCRVTVTVRAEATQVVHNGEDAVSAAGWPTA